MTHKTMAELEAENVEGFINPKRTPQEWKEFEERAKTVREHDRLHTAFETEPEEPEESEEEEE